VISFQPSSEGEPDSDRWITGRAVEEACQTAGLPNDSHEHFEAGIMPHAVRERYYFHVRPGQPFNLEVDISAYVDKKIDAIVECRSQGNGNAGSQLRARLAKEGRRLPLLGEDDRTADRAYARQFLLEDFRERFEYHGPMPDQTAAKVEDYISKNAVRI